MTAKSSPSIYEFLVSILLPEGTLSLFAVTQVEEEYTGKPDETGTEVRIIHIYLDERDLRDKEWHDLQPNGFTESRSINDFPIRDHKVILHVRRRRWQNADGTSIILSHFNCGRQQLFKGICCCLFFGYLPHTGPFSGAVL